MPAVGPGTSIGGRYHLRQRLTRTDRVERWEADDTRFGRRVQVTVLDATDPAADAALDAARRASSLTDPRLLPILDAGVEDGLVHLVEQDPTGLVPLSHSLQDGPLPAREARRVVLEVAEVLERARSRGLHHLVLTPVDVLRGRDGSVRLRGLAVHGALGGRDETDADASRSDATALAAVLHAALTATWPGEGHTSLRPTPQVAGAPAAPSELVAAVPADLEALVTSALGRPGHEGERTGPTTPGEVADALRAGADTGPELPTAEPAADPQAEVFTTPDDLRTDVDHVPSKAEAAALAAAGATAAGARAVGRGVSQAAREAARRAAERRREREERREEELAARVPFDALATEAEGDAEPVAPVFVNDVPTGTPSRRQASFVLALVGSLMVAALVAGVIGVVAMVTNIQRQLDAPPVARTYTVSAPAVTVTMGADGRVLARQTAAPSPTGGAPVAIVGVSAYDPEGDDKAENNGTVGNVRDGDPRTYWRSQRYKTDTFGNLKSGVGLAVYLGDTPHGLTQVKLTLPDNAGQDVVVYGSATATKDGATTLGEAKGAKGEVTIPVAPGTGAHPYVIVWFTNSPAQFGGHYAALSEIALS